MDINARRFCVGLYSSFYLRGESVEVVSVPEVEGGARDCEVTECSLVRFFDLLASPDSECDILSVSSPNYQLILHVPQALSFSEKRLH